MDPGTATTGFSIIENQKGKITLLDYGCIKTKSGLQPAIRLQQIADDLKYLLAKWQPQKASIEKIFFRKNIKTAIGVAQARGVLLQKLTEQGIEPNEYTPLEIKASICGYGRADKEMVQKMIKLTLGLQETPKPDDAADAIAAAICLANSLALSQAIHQ
ncbi:crossover junction endodeoxyribonuclease RuvC [Candidatus Peregrinibacteria bacterium]|nr:crossover junction endodeoxyribonuclease RuvC [Candidatus Peregrinibacteria bacterium]